MSLSIFWTLSISFQALSVNCSNLIEEDWSSRIEKNCNFAVRWNSGLEIIGFIVCTNVIVNFLDFIHQLWRQLSSCDDPLTNQILIWVKKDCDFLKWDAKELRLFFGKSMVLWLFRYSRRWLIRQWLLRKRNFSNWTASSISCCNFNLKFWYSLIEWTVSQ